MDFIIGLIVSYIDFSLMIGSYMAYGMIILMLLVVIFAIVKAIIESLASFIRRTL